MADPPPVDAELSMACYNAVAQRRLQYDALMWQVPALSLTAQAFLFTIALDGGAGRLARVLAGLLAAIVSFLTVQLMAKHRWHERIDSNWLDRFEQRSGLEPVHGRRRRLAEGVGLSGPHLLIRWSSYRLWQCGITMFGVVGLACAAVSACAPQLLA